MRGRQDKSGLVAGILLPIGMICLFAFCSLALALLGGRAYKQIQAGVDDSINTTVAASYLRTKLSQNNTAGAVSLRQEGEADVLVIATTSGDGASYETRIFLAEGTLRESFVPASDTFNAAGGIEIAQLQACSFSLEEGGLFTAEMTSPAGSVARTAFALTQGGEL